MVARAANAGRTLHMGPSLSQQHTQPPLLRMLYELTPCRMCLPLQAQYVAPAVRCCNGKQLKALPPGVRLTSPTCFAIAAAAKKQAVAGAGAGTVPHGQEPRDLQPQAIAQMLASKINNQLRCNADTTKDAMGSSGSGSGAAPAAGMPIGRVPGGPGPEPLPLPGGSPPLPSCMVLEVQAADGHLNFVLQRDHEREQEHNLGQGAQDPAPLLQGLAADGAARSQGVFHVASSSIWVARAMPCLDCTAAEHVELLLMWVAALQMLVLSQKRDHAPALPAGATSTSGNQGPAPPPSHSAARRGRRDGATPRSSGSGSGHRAARASGGASAAAAAAAAAAAMVERLEVPSGRFEMRLVPSTFDREEYELYKRYAAVGRKQH